MNLGALHLSLQLDLLLSVCLRIPSARISDHLDLAHVELVDGEVVQERLVCGIHFLLGSILNQ